MRIRFRGAVEQTCDHDAGMAFEPLFRSVVVGIVPQPREIPPAPFEREDVQRLFADLNREHPYQQLAFAPGDIGARFTRSPDDFVSIEPGLIQIQMPVSMTTQLATDRVVSLLRTAFARLALDQVLQCGIKIIANVAVPDAKSFVSDRLMRADQVKELGPGFFGGGVKFRRIEEGREDNLSLEPFVRDNGFLYVDYDVLRVAVDGPMAGLDQLGSLLDEAFSFVGNEAVALLTM